MLSKETQLQLYYKNFFKSLKNEKLYRTDFCSEREFKGAVKDYMHNYNTAHIQN